MSLSRFVVACAVAIALSLLGQSAYAGTVFTNGVAAAEKQATQQSGITLVHGHGHGHGHWGGWGGRGGFGFYGAPFLPYYYDDYYYPYYGYGYYRRGHRYYRGHHHYHHHHH